MGASAIVRERESARVSDLYSMQPNFRYIVLKVHSHIRRRPSESGIGVSE